MNILNTLKPAQSKQIKIIHLKKDVVLYRENDRCDHIGVVIKGQVSIVSYLNNGNMVIYNTINENEIFGNNLIFSSEPFYKGNIITNVNSEIAIISKNLLIKLLKTNDAFMIEYFAAQSNFTKVLNNKIKLLSIDSAEERFLFYMHENKNKILIKSISDLANELFLQRETLSRLLSKLQKQNKIKREDKIISII